MRSSAACLTLLFILSLSVVPMTHAQQPPETTETMRYYLQSGDPTTVLGGTRALWDGGISDMPTVFNMTLFNMDNPTPQGSEVACSWCDFATRPLVSHHVFKSFKLHLYVRWPTQCAHFPQFTNLNDTYVDFGIGSAASDLSKIYGYQYRDYSHPARHATVLNFTVSGWDVNVGQQVSVAIDRGKRLVFHFGISPPFSGNETLCMCDQLCAAWAHLSAGPMVFPYVLFGDAEHASYIETDAVELQGQPVPEFPSFLIMLPVILALTILLRRERNRHCPATKSTAGKI